MKEILPMEFVLKCPNEFGSEQPLTYLFNEKMHEEFIWKVIVQFSQDVIVFRNKFGFICFHSPLFFCCFKCVLFTVCYFAVNFVPHNFYLSYKNCIICIFCRVYLLIKCKITVLVSVSNSPLEHSLSSYTTNAIQQI